MAQLKKLSRNAGFMKQLYRINISTVHAIPKDRTVFDSVYTEGDTIVEAMKELLFGRGEHNDSTNG